jgi:FlaA1/EpsC-like NDP-sugar epimerase
MMETMTLDEQQMLLGRRVEGLLSADDRFAFTGRVCMITGAGGSVGSELARQIAACRPARLILVENSEVALFRIEDALLETLSPGALEPVLCDVTRSGAVARMMRRHRPDIVFHAAAYKHVTMAERAVCATARVNVLGTSAVLAAAEEVGAKFVLISTDKAAEPRSVMGATKRLAEIVALESGARASRPVVVRFGNVLASSGSVVEVMRDRIRAGKPVLLTDPNATRFFMTVSEAASLVMKATTLARGGETFWLDMGEQVRIGDLTERLLDVSAQQGLSPVPVRIVGLRPGEKMNEQLAAQGIRLEKTSDRRVWVAHQEPATHARVSEWTQALRRAIARDDAHAVLTTLTAAVRDFVPSDQAWDTAAVNQAARTSVAGEREPARDLRRKAALPQVAAATPRARRTAAGASEPRATAKIIPMRRRG